MTNKARRVFSLPAFVVLTTVLILNSLIYMPFLSDDALISMRYSARLADGHGLTWTGGSAVEGYSNLLWVLLTTGGISVGLDGVAAVRLLGVLSLICFVFCVLFTYRKNITREYMIVLLFAVISAPLGVWSIGGLEQPLVAALLALSIPLIWRVIDKKEAGFARYFTASIPLALLCITRPDGVIFTFAALLVLLFSGNGRRSFLLAVFPVLIMLAQLGFRLGYYGDYVPNTARIKMRPSVHYSIGGVKYLIRGVFVLFPLSMFSIYATFKAVRKRHFRTLLPAAMALSWMMYLVLIGGDIFPAYRHFVPLVVLFTWICIEELPEIRRTFRSVALFAVILLLFVVLQYADSRNRDAREELWEWDGQVTALVLKEAFAEQQPLLAVTAAGSLPYWSELPSLDMLGLNDRYLALNQGNSTEHGLLGHNVCNPVHILERQPDIISFNVAGVPSGLAVAESLSISSEFQRLYSRVIVRGTEPYTSHGVLWFNRESPLTGIKTSADSMVIPAYFFNQYKHTVMFNQNGVPGIAVTCDAPAGIVLADVPPGSEWIPVEYSSSLSVQLQYSGDSLIVELATDQTDPVFVKEVVLIPDQ
ncbi:MAG: hypothetical protein U9P42_02465 [Candidatus Fermentibacteria bacterium]|nr:hypothetical protein [Candidatus Fermentibacteria bacterium]